MQTSPKRYQGQVNRQSRAYQVVLDGRLIKDSQDPLPGLCPGDG